MAVKEKDYTDVVEKIEGAMEHVGTKDGIATYNVKQSDYMAFMKGRGITEDTIRQVSEADIDYMNGNIVVANKLLLEDSELDRAVIKTRSPMGVKEFRYTRRVEGRAPKTGESTIKFGVASVNLKIKTRLDKELLQRCSEAIEKA